MNAISMIPWALGTIAFVALVVGLMLYFKQQHPAALATAEGDWAAVHKKLDTLLQSGETLLDHLHILHTAVQSPVTVALVPVQTAPAPAAEPPAAAPPAPVQQSTDAAAPGYVAPPAAAAPAPAPAPATADPGIPPLTSMTYAQFQAAGGTAYIAGPVNVTITECPPHVVVRTIARSSYPTDNEYTLTVNGASKVCNNPLNTCQIPATGPNVEIAVGQSAGSNLNVQIVQ